jgi:hypothetical protein
MVHVNWSDPKGHVSLRYIGNEILYDGIGNNGVPFIAANKYAAEDLQLYEGYQLTSLSFYRYVRPDVSISTQPKFKWFVSQGEERIFEESVTDAHEGWNRFELPTPLPIDVSKPLYYGVEVVEHATNDWPVGAGVIYTPDFEQSLDIAVTYAYGRANLYSEDEGATWLPLEKQVPYALFYIQATLDKDPATAPQDRLLGYKVFRNGVNLLEEEFGVGSISLLNNYTDRNPLVGENACYTIYADYTSLNLSEGATACLTITGVDLIKDENGMRAYPNGVRKNETITVELCNWENAVIALYDLSGKKVKTVKATGQKTPVRLNVEAGVYILKVNGLDAVKIVVK